MVGYGPVGQTMVRLLRDNEIVPVVLEMNLDTVHRLHAEGVTALFGDATHPETLRQAGPRRGAGPYPHFLRARAPAISSWKPAA